MCGSCLDPPLPSAAESRGGVVHPIEAVGDVGAEVDEPRRTKDAAAVLAPRGRDDPLFGLRAPGAEIDVRLVEFVDQTEGYEHQAAAQREVIGGAVIDEIGRASCRERV